MKLSRYLAPLAALAMVPGTAMAAGQHEDRPAAEAQIPFANYNGVRNWRAVGDRTIYFEDQHDNWYKATLFSPAFDLPFSQAIGLIPGPTGALNRWSAVWIDGQVHQFQSFEAVAGPPSSSHDAH